MTVYTYREEGCERCGTEEVETIETTETRISSHMRDHSIHLCCFCYETHLGNILNYSHLYPGQETMARGLIQAFHIIKKASTK